MVATCSLLVINGREVTVKYTTCMIRTSMQWQSTAMAVKATLISFLELCQGD